MCSALPQRVLYKVLNHPEQSSCICVHVLVVVVVVVVVVVIVVVVIVVVVVHVNILSNQHNYEKRYLCDTVFQYINQYLRVES